MSYADYNFYCENGGSLSEDDYNRYVNKATFCIDTYTRGRASSAPISMQNNIKLCECTLVDTLHAISDLPTGLSAAGNDGVSESYDKEEKDKACYKNCRMYLTQPVNLMYAGVD